MLRHIPCRHTYIVAAGFRTIFAQPNADAVSETWDQVRDQLASVFPKMPTIGGTKDRAG